MLAAIKRNEVNDIYGWRFITCLDALTKVLESTTNVEFIVNLVLDALRLSTNIKLFPYHIRLFNTLIQI